MRPFLQAKHSTANYVSKNLSARFWPWFSKFRRNFFGVLLHPVTVFVVLQVVCVAFTVILVFWYVNKGTHGPYFDRGYDLMFLISGCILSSIILVGTVTLFVFALRQKNLYKQQRSFVSSVTHELRSPIASMQLSLETVQARNLDKEVVNKIYGMILQDLNRLVNLVDQILVSARLDRGIKVFNQIDTFAIKDVIEEVIENGRHWDANLSQRVKVICSEDIKMNTAKLAVRLMLVNLIENAVKYSPTHSQISIEVEQIGKNVYLDIADQGFGLEKRDTRRIFKIFHRAETAEKKAIPGTGLGLYIVKTIAEVLGGKVWAESPGIGKGSTFFVVLPVDFPQTI